MSASWMSLIVLCAAVLRVANNLPVEGDVDLSLDSSLEDDVGSIRSSTSDESNSKEPGGVDLLSRDKRTIGVLRQVFPGLSQIVDRKIQMLTRLIFRFIGRLVLRGGAGGGAGGTTGTSGDSGRKISITLPTYPPSPDDEEDEDETEAPEEGASTTTLAPGASDEAPDSPDSTDDATTTTTEASDAENSVSESKISEVKVRVTREAENSNTNDDQAADATGDNETDNDLDSTSSTDNESEGSDENPRNKRLLNFNLGGGGGGSGGGSGNFLFDIIRLVAGSGTTQEKDEAENAPVDDSTGGGDSGTDLTSGKSDDGYSAGVPGPLTRLFVIANRGISNLMQDLILRLAQTSERIVNFKARLITSII